MILKKQLKNIALITTLAGTATSAFAEAPLLRIDDTTSISGIVNASASFNDNIYLSSTDKKSDVILKVTPGLEFVKGGNDSRHTLSVRALVDFILYMSESDNNSCLPHASLGYNFAGDKLNANINAGVDYNMSTSNRDRRDGQLTRYWSYYASAIANYAATERLSIMTGFRWNGTTYTKQEESYNDRQRYSIPVNIYHVFPSGMFKAGLAYEYSYSDLAARKNSTTNPGCQEVHFIGLTAEGKEISQKIDLNGRIGYTTSDWHKREYAGNGRQNTLGVSLNAIYYASEKTTLNLMLSRDFEISSDGQGITSTGVQLGANYAIDTRWSANGSISFKNDDYNYGGRKDDVWTGRVGCAYQINDYLSANASYTFQWDDSNQAGNDYTNNIVTVGLNFRY